MNPQQNNQWFIHAQAVTVLRLTMRSELNIKDYRNSHLSSDDIIKDIAILERDVNKAWKTAFAVHTGIVLDDRYYMFVRAVEGGCSFMLTEKLRQMELGNVDFSN